MVTPTHTRFEYLSRCFSNYFEENQPNADEVESFKRQKMALYEMENSAFLRVNEAFGPVWIYIEPLIGSNGRTYDEDIVDR